MINSDPLAFLDELTEAEPEASADVGADPLSFLEESSEAKPPSSRTRTKNYLAKEDESADPLDFLEKPKEAKPFMEKALDVYKGFEGKLDPKVLERMEQAEELNREREMRQSKGFTKGALSGLTLSASEHIPGLKPDEEDLMVGLGEAVGSYLPIAKLYNFIGKPLVNLAAKSPIARQGLMALARMTGFGATGATYKAGKELVQGEVPTAAELGKEAATWAAIDAVLQSVGLGIAFQQSVGRIAEQEGMTSKEVLGKLWDATKRRFKRPIHAEEISQAEVEALAEEAVKAEKQGFREVEIEAEPVAKEKPPETEAVPEGRVPAVATEAVKPPEKIDLTGMGKGITDNLYAGIYKALVEGKDTFSGVKDPLIVRAKPYFDKGLITSAEDLRKFANEGPQAFEKPETKEALTIPENAVLDKPESISIGIRAGKGTASIPVRKVGEGDKEYFSHDDVPVTREEKELIDASNAWDKAGDSKEAAAAAQQARQMVFDRLKGRPSTKPEVAEAKPKHEDEWEYTYEDFPTKAEAQEYLDHLQMSLKKAPEGHKATLQRDIANLEGIIRGFEKKEAMEKAPEKPKKKAVKTKEERAADIRGIVKEIHDLKKELKTAKGSAAKNRLVNEIREKAHELQRLKKPLVEIPEQQIDVTPKKLKSQKEYFVDELEDAIAHPTDKVFVTV